MDSRSIARCRLRRARIAHDALEGVGLAEEAGTRDGACGATLEGARCRLVSLLFEEGIVREILLDGV